MRLRIEPGGLEWTARALLLACLLILLWRVWSPASVSSEESVTSRDLTESLRRWTTAAAPIRAEVRLDRLPTAVERDWLAALAHGGSEVAWSGELDPLAVEAVASGEPQHSYVIRVSGAPGADMRISDGAREIAAVAAGAVAASMRTTVLSGPVSVDAAGGRASAAAPRARRVGRAALIGPAGWETKFVIAALEERGWRVDSRVTVGPGVSVGTLGQAALDTSRYAAAVVIEQLPGGWLPQLTRFVRTGGGLIVAGGAVRDRSLSALLPAQPGRALAVRDTAVVRRDGLGGFSVTPGPRGVVLETRAEAPVVVAGRVGNGRVVLAGYADTWNWRLRGDEDALEAHRDWWSAVVGAAAYAPDTAQAIHSPESAPLAALHAALGPPETAGSSDLLRDRGVPVEALLFGLATLSLLAETVSRRRRGLP